MVSNHGARQLDGVEATIDALPAIVEVVNKADPKVEVYLDVPAESENSPLGGPSASPSWPAGS